MLTKAGESIARVAAFGRLPNQPIGTLGNITPAKIRDVNDLKKQYSGPVSEEVSKAYREQQKAKTKKPAQ